MNRKSLIFLIFAVVTGWGLLLVRGDSVVPDSDSRLSPEWLRDGVIYEIFPRDFSTAGNLGGVTANLGRLHRLGVNILWLMPVQPIGKKMRAGELGSPYSIQDFYAIDPAYGTAGDLKILVKRAHHRGMKVILDLVADHTSWDSVMMKHPEFYKHDSAGNIVSPVPAWRDVAALDYSNEGLRRYMISMLKYWIVTYDVDGFRCDSAAMVPTDFWEQARTELSRTKPDIILLAEASKPELLTNGFDIDYSWPLLGALDDVLIKGSSADKLRQSWVDSEAKFPRGALHMRISDDHDEIRAVNRYGFKAALAASALMFTLDGVPLLYNGMEIGDNNESSGGALFKKEVIRWQTPRQPQWPVLYRDLIRLRHKYHAFQDSPVDWLHNSDEKSLVSFRRADETDEFLVVINFSNQPVTGRVTLEPADGFARVKISGVDSNTGSFPNIHLEGYGWAIFHRTAIPTQAVTGRMSQKSTGGESDAH